MEKTKSFFGNLKHGLLKTSSKLTSGLKNIFSNNKKIDIKTLEELEELLISIDVGYDTATKLTQKIAEVKLHSELTYDQIKEKLAKLIKEILEPFASPIKINNKPHVIMLCGVNGNGKTTTTAKLAYKYKKENKSVMVAACDTFRAAAVEQLKIWAERINCPIVFGEHGADSASIAYKAISEAINNNIDIVIIDTAGRLHTHKNLMQELEKVYRIIQKQLPISAISTVLVLDATTGQNAYKQVDIFKQYIDIDGIIITKLDGTAKGGAILGLVEKHKVNLHAIGLGEGIDDLKDFNAQEFAESLLD